MPMKYAISAPTPRGASAMTQEIILYTRSLSASKKLKTGAILCFPSASMAKAVRIVKKRIPSTSRFAIASMGLVGMILNRRSGIVGLSPFESNPAGISQFSSAPGLTRFTTTMPMVAAAIIVRPYSSIVWTPMLPIFLTLPKLAMPIKTVATIKGTISIFRSRMKSSPTT
ncbi:MAG: hypothetical protein CNCCGFBP_02335 [Fimbriimonadaceae bacterium]|nr:hypothetical protein [Fimbriimonadaceae bacterium]